MPQRFGKQSGGALGVAMRVARLLAKSPEHGAETLVYLASSPDVATITGAFFYERRRGTLTRAEPASTSHTPNSCCS